MLRWGILRRSNAAAPSHWSTPEETLHLVARERDLADRFQGGFTVLTFRLPDQGADDACRELARGLEQRLRISDETGWLDSSGRLVGVILHRTPGWGAWQLAETVCSSIGSKTPPPAVAVYAYPAAPPWNQGQQDEDELPPGTEPRRVAALDDLLEELSARPARIFEIGHGGPVPVV